MNSYLENLLELAEKLKGQDDAGDVCAELARRLKKAWWALKKARGREPLAHEFVCQTLDEIEEPPEK